MEATLRCYIMRPKLVVCADCDNGRIAFLDIAFAISALAIAGLCSRLYKRRRKSCTIVGFETSPPLTFALAFRLARCLQRCVGSGASLQRSVSLLAPALGRMLGPLHPHTIDDSLGVGPLPALPSRRAYRRMSYRPA